MCEMWEICRRIKCSVPMQILMVFLFLTSIVGLSLLKLHLKNSVGEERDSGQFNNCKYLNCIHLKYITDLRICKNKMLFRVSTW